MAASKKPIIISLDGNIGAGKTTLLQELYKLSPDIQIIPEPIETWTSYIDESGKNLLQLFYEDKQRWAYTFQNCAIITRIMTIKDTLKQYPNKKVFITERSLLTDRYVFAEMLYSDGLLNQLEWKLYNKWYAEFSEQVSIDGIIYVTTNPEISGERIKCRGRPGEDKIDASYLNKLHIQHNKWISETNIPVLKISTETDISPAINVRKITQFIEGLNQGNQNVCST